MDLTTIKKELHDYIEDADENILKAIYTILLTEEPNDDFEISEEQKRILDERLKAYYENPSDVITWNEVKEKYQKK